MWLKVHIWDHIYPDLRMEISPKLFAMRQKAKVWDHIYPGLFMKISTKLFVMWLKPKLWDLILSRPVHGYVHRSNSNVVTNLYVGSYFTQTFMEIFIRRLVMW